MSIGNADPLSSIPCHNGMMTFARLSNNQIEFGRKRVAAKKDDVCAAPRYVFDLTFYGWKVSINQDFASEKDTRSFGATFLSINGLHVASLTDACITNDCENRNVHPQLT